MGMGMRGKIVVISKNEIGKKKMNLAQLSVREKKYFSLHHTYLGILLILWFRDISIWG